MPPNAPLPAPPASATAGRPLVTRRAARCALALATLALLAPAPAPAAPRAAVPDGAVAEGLVKITLRGIDQAYARPGWSLAAYRRVTIDPVEVDFDAAWAPRRTGRREPLDAAERESIRSDLAVVVREAFVTTLQAGHGYPVTDEVADDVLRLRPRIVDLFVNAPDTMAPGRTQTYTYSTGHMTLRADLLDAVSGQVLLRLADRRESHDTGTLTLTNRTTHAWDASVAASHWARVLRAALDEAHGGGHR